MSDDLPEWLRGNGCIADCDCKDNCRVKEAADEIERLKASRCECDDECALSIENERLRSRNAEAAAFLDGLANCIEDIDNQHKIDAAAADCRAMAAKLREGK